MESFMVAAKAQNGAVEPYEKKEKIYHRVPVPTCFFNMKRRIK
jgi:hypothetical protein